MVNITLRVLSKPDMESLPAIFKVSISLVVVLVAISWPCQDLQRMNVGLAPRASEQHFSCLIPV